MKSRLVLPLLALSISFHSSATHAQWQPDGIPVSTAASGQNNQTITTDGAGGAIVTWEDQRNNPANDIYAQRITAAGTTQWTTDGVAVCTATLGQYGPSSASDGLGGAVVAWYDFRNNVSLDIYAQRVSATGVMQWTANGVAICTSAGDQSFPVMLADGAGGAIIAWSDNRGASVDIYAQRVNSAGVVQWTANGVAICTAVGNQSTPVIVSDGAGGAIIAWPDNRGGSTDVYAQRINASGAVQWAANGVVVSAAPVDQYQVAMIPDGAGGAIVAFTDTRTSPTPDIYAQRINSAGAAQWLVNGVLLCAAASNQGEPFPVTDGAGGALVAWTDYRSGPEADIYAQRVSATGNVQWASDGLALSTASGNQAIPRMISDGAGGAVAAWRDDRHGNFDVYAQRVNGQGAVQWAYDTMPLTQAPSNQVNALMVPDNAGGGIVAWVDTRANTFDIYAQRVEFAEGYWGHPEPTVTAVADIPGDQGGKVKVNWKASGWDIRTLATISHYSIWRAVDAATFSAAQTIGGATIVDDLSRIGRDFKGVAYRKDSAAAVTPRYWEWIGNQDAIFATGYSMAASTRSDSTLGNTSKTYFQVVSHTYNDPATIWTSNEMSGRSVDNLAPAAPLLLTAQRSGNYVHLKWKRVHAPDLRSYSVYRKTSSGVTAVPVNFLSSANDTVLTDTSPPASSAYYIVTAYDVHANQSGASNEAAVAPATGVGNLPPITALTVLQNNPNPFTGETELNVGLPRASDVKIEVFDVAGRKVSDIVVNHASAGWQKVTFSGRDDAGHALVSGVYFYRVHANGATVTRKMVIAR